MPIFKLLSNRLLGSDPGSKIPDAISQLENNIAGLIGAVLDTDYSDRIVAMREEGVTGGNNHNHDGTNTAKVDHNNLLNKGSYTHAQIDQHINAFAPHSGHEVITNKGLPNGYCPLDATGKIPVVHLPTIQASADAAYGIVSLPISVSLGSGETAIYFPAGAATYSLSTVGSISLSGDAFQIGPGRYLFGVCGLISGDNSLPVVRTEPEAYVVDGSFFSCGIYIPYTSGSNKYCPFSGTAVLHTPVAAGAKLGVRVVTTSSANATLQSLSVYIGKLL